MLKRRILSVLLVLAMLVPFAGAAQTAQDNMRGVWVASVANIDYPSSAGMTAQALADKLNGNFGAFPISEDDLPAALRTELMDDSRPLTALWMPLTMPRTTDKMPLTAL